MIDLISPHNSLVKAVLYYIRLDTHSSALFEKEETAAISFAQIAADELLAAAANKSITLNRWTITPDAIHALVYINEDQLDQNHQVGKPRLLTSFVAGVKAATAKRINLVRNQPGQSVWKRSYKEQLVEDERMLSRLTAKINAADSVVGSK